MGKEVENEGRRGRNKVARRQKQRGKEVEIEEKGGRNRGLQRQSRLCEPSATANSVPRLKSSQEQNWPLHQVRTFYSTSFPLYFYLFSPLFLPNFPSIFTSFPLYFYLISPLFLPIFPSIFTYFPFYFWLSLNSYFLHLGLFFFSPLPFLLYYSETVFQFLSSFALFSTIPHCLLIFNLFICSFKVHQGGQRERISQQLLVVAVLSFLVRYQSFCTF